MHRDAFLLSFPLPPSSLASWIPDLFHPRLPWRVHHLLTSTPRQFRPHSEALWLLIRCFPEGSCSVHAAGCWTCQGWAECWFSVNDTGVHLIDWGCFKPPRKISPHCACGSPTLCPQWLGVLLPGQQPLSCAWDGHSFSGLRKHALQLQERWRRSSQLKET